MIITTIPIAEFLQVLATHQECDRYLTCMKLTPELLRQWSYEDRAATFLAAGERDYANLGALMFALARAEIVRTVCGSESFFLQ